MSDMRTIIEYLSDYNTPAATKKMIRLIKKNDCNAVYELFNEASMTEEAEEAIEIVKDKWLELAVKYGRLKIYNVIRETDPGMDGVFIVAYLYGRLQILKNIGFDNIDLDYVIRHPYRQHKRYLPGYGVQASPVQMYSFMVSVALNTGSVHAKKLIELAGMDKSIMKLQTHFRYRPGGPEYRKLEKDFKKKEHKIVRK
jgi:hypothetical protein